MLSSTPRAPRFLLDENVRRELGAFCRKQNINAKRLPPRATDALIASVSKRERRVLVTNDKDFARVAADRLFEWYF